MRLPEGERLAPLGELSRKEEPVKDEPELNDPLFERPPLLALEELAVCWGTDRRPFFGRGVAGKAGARLPIGEDFFVLALAAPAEKPGELVEDTGEPAADSTEL